MQRARLFLTCALAAMALTLAGCADDGSDGKAGADGTDYPGPLPAEYEDADGIAGGSVYDQWYSTLAGGLGSTASYSITVASDFVRCKACHAWDGLGNAASYAARTGQSTGAATRPDVSSVNLRSTIRRVTPQALFELVKGEGGRAANATANGHPDFSALLSDAQIWNLVKAMREEWVNPNDLYTVTVTGPPVYTDDGGAVVPPVVAYSGVGAGGVAANGDAVYASTCAGCHGADGQAILIGGTTTLGAFMRASPHEAWLKMKFGQPGSSPAMGSGLVTAAEDIVDIYAAFQNATTYP